MGDPFPSNVDFVDRPLTVTVRSSSVRDAGSPSVASLASRSMDWLCSRPEGSVTVRRSETRITTLTPNSHFSIPVVGHWSVKKTGQHPNRQACEGSDTNPIHDFQYPFAAFCQYTRARRRDTPDSLTVSRVGVKFCTRTKRKDHPTKYPPYSRGKRHKSSSQHEEIGHPSTEPRRQPLWLPLLFVHALQHFAPRNVRQ